VVARVRPALRAGRSTPLAESLTRLESLVSPWTGPVRRTGEALWETDEAAFIRWEAELCDVAALTGAALRNPFAGSVHYDRARARAGAIGEALERYASVHVPDGLPLDTAAALGAQAVEPASFALFAREQYAAEGFRFGPFEAATPVRWTHGWRLPDCRPVMLPAQLVYLCEGVVAGETRIGYATTSGNACGASLEEALLGGLLELVERDAFTIAWNARLTLPRFDLSDFEYAAYYARTGLEYRAIDLSAMLGVPAAVATVRDERSGLAALAVGAAAATSAAQAVDKAIREAFHSRGWAAHRHAREPERVAGLRAEEIDAFDQHVLYYCALERARETAFFDAGSVRSGLAGTCDLREGTPYGQLLELLERLNARGVDVYFVDLTPDDVREAGLHVVSVVAPQLARIDASHRYRYLGGERPYEVPAALGLAPRRLAFDDLNPHPHPFP
jgi:ribosomal protein S12 methylthiotransferase accessory factor